MVLFIAALFLVVTLVSGCVIHRRGGYYGPYERPVLVKSRVAVTAPAPVVTFTFTDRHRHTVWDYYHDHPHHYHGKKYRKRWKHKRHARLHRGIQMQVIPIPLSRQLPPAPRGTRYVYDDDQILLIDRNTREVLDFINIPEYDEPRVVVTVPAPITFTFNDHHRHTVSDYYHRHPRHHHGKKHKHRKKWQYKRKAHLHSHTQMQIIPFELVSQLPPAPRGTRYVYDDDQVLLIDKRTRVVLDFINIPEYDEPRVVIAVPAPTTYTFNDHHRHTVRNYYHSHPRNHHGKKHKHKKKRHKKKWKHKWKHKRKVHLPREIQVEVVPVALVRQLPPPPRGTRFVYYDDQMMLIDVSTRMVLDFIDISVSAGR
jgi:Ni/Co efflux regulator RcnB